MQLTMGQGLSGALVPRYCVDAHPQEYGDRTIHDLTPDACPRLPLPQHQESLGWYADLDAALVGARLRYKSASPCIYCCKARAIGAFPVAVAFR